MLIFSFVIYFKRRKNGEKKEQQPHAGVAHCNFDEERTEFMRVYTHIPAVRAYKLTTAEKKERMAGDKNKDAALVLGKTSGFNLVYIRVKFLRGFFRSRVSTKARIFDIFRKKFRRYTQCI